MRIYYHILSFLGQFWLFLIIGFLTFLHICWMPWYIWSLSLYTLLFWTFQFYKYCDEHYLLSLFHSSHYYRIKLNCRNYNIWYISPNWLYLFTHTSIVHDGWKVAVNYDIHPFLLALGVLSVCVNVLSISTLKISYVLLYAFPFSEWEISNFYSHSIA